jgi:hypothetical protein
VDLEVDLGVDGDVLLAVVKGLATFDDSWQVLQQICDMALEKHLERILIDGLAVYGTPTSFERYDIGVKLVAYCGEHKLWPRLAFVGHPPVIDGFGGVVARNRGVHAQIFPNRQEAVEWLQAA